jgi:hypothetical protein
MAPESVGFPYPQSFFRNRDKNDEPRFLNTDISDYRIHLLAINSYRSLQQANKNFMNSSLQKKS